DLGDQPTALGADQFAPGFAAGRGGVGDHELEVHRAVVVGADGPAAVPAAEAVAHPLAARLGHHRRGGGVGGRDQPDLAGLLVARLDQDVAAVGGGAD